MKKSIGERDSGMKLILHLVKTGFDPRDLVMLVIRLTENGIRVKGTDRPYEFMVSCRTDLNPIMVKLLKAYMPRTSSLMNMSRKHVYLEKLTHDYLKNLDDMGEDVITNDEPVIMMKDQHIRINVKNGRPDVKRIIIEVAEENQNDTD